MKGPLVMVASLMLSACASLEVQVDVMEPRYASAAALQAGLQMEANDIAASPHARTDFFVDRAYAAYDQYRVACLNELLATARGATIPPGEEEGYQGWISDIQDTIENNESVISEREAARQRLRALNEAVLAAVAANPAAVGRPGTPVQPMAGPVQEKLLARRAGIDAEAALIQGYVDSNSNICVQQFEQARSQLPWLFGTATADIGRPAPQAAMRSKEQVELARRASIVGGGTLLNQSLEAFYVTQADDRFWATRYNRAFASGMFGSTSIALVMNDTADFSVKGFVFDGRSTAQMVQKVGVQAVSLLAAAHGAPIGLGRPPNSPTGGPTYFNTSELLSTNVTALERARAQDEAYERSLVRIADSVLSQWDGLVAGNATARQIVRGTFEAHRGSWSAAPPPQQP